MRGLIVVHTEIDYCDPVEMEDEGIDTADVFIRIGLEIEEVLKSGGTVYYLPGSDNRADIYPAIATHSKHMRFIDHSYAEAQYLLTKEAIMEDGLEEVVVSGVACDGCAADVYHLMKGEEGPDTKKGDYEKLITELSWSCEKLEDVFTTVVNTTFPRRLTNRPYNGRR